MDWIKGYTSYFGTSWKCNKNRDFLTNSGSIEIYGYSLFLSIYRIILTKWNPLFYSVKNDKKSVYLLVRNICRNNRLVYVAIPRKVRLPKDWSERSFFGTIGYFESIEVVVPRCSVKKAFLEISQNSQENACARVSFLNFFSYRTPPVAAFGVLEWIYTL